MIRKLVLGAFAHWQLVGLLGFAIALMCFVHARRTVERGWCSVRFGGRATRIDQPFAFWSEVYLSFSCAWEALRLACIAHGGSLRERSSDPQAYGLPPTKSGCWRPLIVPRSCRSLFPLG